MNYRVIISHGQSNYLYDFPYSEYTVVVLDAPTQEDYEACTKLGYIPVVATASGNRGHNRNCGLFKLLDLYTLSDDDTIEFFDGDRFPIDINAWNRRDIIMNNASLDCLLYVCNESDARLRKLYVPLEGATIVDTGTLCNPFYSCGFAMKAKAIRKIMSFCNGTLFEQRFTSWGCEDQFLGLICSHLDIKVGITCEISLNGRVGGDSDTHADYRDSLQVYIDLIREYGLPIRN